MRDEREGRDRDGGLVIILRAGLLKHMRAC